MIYKTRFVEKIFSIALLLHKITVKQQLFPLKEGTSGLVAPCLFLCLTQLFPFNGQIVSPLVIQHLLSSSSSAVISEFLT